MFQSLILPMKIGVSYGSGALKALQNDNIPELDLLVREAIQNSSDAAINQPGDSCNINFTQGSFSPRHLMRCFRTLGLFLTAVSPMKLLIFLRLGTIRLRD